MVNTIQTKELRDFMRESCADICPSCGADRLTLLGALKEKPVIQEVEYRGIGGCIIRRTEQVGTPNFNLAMMIIENCPDCKDYLLPQTRRELAWEGHGIHI